MKQDGFEYGAVVTTRDDVFVASVPSGLTTPSLLFEALAIALRFPSYFGANWHALFDCLGDLSWIEQHTVILCHGDLPPLDPDDTKAYLDVLADAVSDWSAPDTHSLRVLFPMEVRDAVRFLLSRIEGRS